MVKRNRKTQRNLDIFYMRQDGATYKQIAEAFDISIIRVRQIIDAKTAREAAGEYQPFDWNEWNKLNMQKLAIKKAQEAQGDKENE